MSKNDITGDNIRSKCNSKEYRDNFDKIFGKKDNTEHFTYLNDEDFDKFLEMLDNP